MRQYSSKLSPPLLPLGGCCDSPVVLHPAAICFLPGNPDVPLRKRPPRIPSPWGFGGADPSPPRSSSGGRQQVLCDILLASALGSGTVLWPEPLRGKSPLPGGASGSVDGWPLPRFDSGTMYSLQLLKPFASGAGAACPSIWQPLRGRGADILGSWIEPCLKRALPRAFP